MLNRFKSIFTPKKTRKQNLKYSPYEKRSPRNDNKEKENVNITNNEIEKSDIEVEYERPTSNAKVLIIEKDENKNDIKNDIKKIIPNETENSTEISNPKEESEITIFEKDENDKKEEKKKLNRNDEESSKSKRIKLSSFHYYGTGYSRNSQPYMPARKLQTKKSSVLFYKKILTNIAKEKPTNEIKTSIPEISQTAKLILDVVEKEEKKYKKPMKMKKLEKKSSPSKSTDTEKKLNNNDLKLNSQNIKKTELLPKKRIAPINISGPKSSSQFNFVRQSSSYASHPEIVNLSKTLSSENSELPIFTFERKSSSYSFDNSTSEDKKSKEINKTESETSISKPITGFNWAAAGMKKPTLAADEWKCSVCDAKNKNDADKCVCCEEPNPNKKASDKPKEAPKFTFGGSSSITFGKPAAESSETKTSVSFGNVTDTKSTSTGFDWAAAGMKKPTLAADEWKCSVCDAKNKNDADKCICCEEPNPNKKTSDKPKEAPKFTFGGSSSITFGKPAAESTETKTSVSFGNVTDTKPTSTGFDWAAAGMKKPTLAADEWKCSVCDAKNKNDADKCICCEEPNPNKKASDKSKEAPKFTFGSNSSSITFGNTTGSTISFGQPSTTTTTASTFGFGKPFTSNASSNPISFGSTTTTSSTSKPVGFSFNSTTTNSNTKTTTTGFSFTTSNTTSTSNTFGSSTTMFNTTTTPNNTFSAFSFGNKTNNSNTDPQNK